jgi:cytochrome c biogenesis protein CcmG/thiol:disulfide interchange protein DsbE
MGDETSERSVPARRALAPRLVRITAWVLVVAGVLFLATVELRNRAGTQGGAFSVADYRARPEVVDAPAPDFELPLLEGAGSLRLSSLRGRVVVLNFWASWCSPCRLEAPDLQAAWEDYRHRGVRFVGVDELDDRFAARGFVREFKITYPSVFDPSGSLADDYGFIGLPATFVIDARGTVRYRFQGFVDGETLRTSLDEVLDRSGG